jgi:hypothetical protein
MLLSSTLRKDPDPISHHLPPPAPAHSLPRAVCGGAAKAPTLKARAENGRDPLSVATRQPRCVEPGSADLTTDTRIGDSKSGDPGGGDKVREGSAPFIFFLFSPSLRAPHPPAAAGRGDRPTALLRSLVA